MNETDPKRHGRLSQTVRQMLLLIGAVLVVVTIVIILVRTLGMPLLHVEVVNDSATVDIRTLSEYPTSVTRLVISSQKGGVLLNAIADEIPTQIGKFTLHVGENSLQAIAVDSGRFRPFIPIDGKPFVLRPGVNYRIEIWDKSQSRVGYVKFH